MQMTIFDFVNKEKIKRHGISYKDTPATKRVNVFMDLQVWFIDYIADKEIPFRPWCFWGSKIYAQGNSYFHFGDHYDEMVVDGKKKTNICKNTYTLFWQKHRTLEDYKEMVIKSFERWNNG